MTWPAPPPGSRQRNKLLMTHTVTETQISALPVDLPAVMFTHAGDERGGGGGEAVNYVLLLADIISGQILPSDARHGVAKKTHGDQKQPEEEEKRQERKKKVGRQTVVINPLQPRFHLASTEAARV